MAKELPPILRQYDRLIAVAVLAVIAVSLLYLILFGLQRQKDLDDYRVRVAAPSSETIQPKTYAAAPDAVEPLRPRANATAPDLFTPERRFLCVKCARPIPALADVCTYADCKAEQPKEKKIDLSTIDSDGDGLPDVWEVAHKLDPQNPDDADLDADADGFTNAEEYAAKTDPGDPKSHPGYETRMKLGAISGEKVPLRINNAMQLPAETGPDGKQITPFLVTFVSVSPDGVEGSTPLRVKTGDPIGKSGFRLVSYDKRDKKPIRVGPHKTLLLVEVSTAQVARISDGKTATLTFHDPKNTDWPGEPLFEQKVEILFDLPGVAPVTVAPGATFTVKGEAFTLRELNAAEKTAKVEKKADKRVFELQ